METEMSQAIDLKQAERKVFTMFYRDGIWDILVGYIVSVFAISPVLRPAMGETWGTLIFFPVGLLVWLVLLLIRKFVVAPRAGVVVLSRERRKLMTLTFFLIFVVHLGAQLLGFDLLDLTEDPSRTNSYKFGILAAGLFFVPAILLKFRRLYIYGILVAVSPLIGELMYEKWGTAHHGYPITFGTTAAILIVTGLALLIRVLRGAPESSVEA